MFQPSQSVNVPAEYWPTALLPLERKKERKKTTNGTKQSEYHDNFPIGDAVVRNGNV